MDVLAESEGKVYGAFVIDSPEDFSSPFNGTSFPCLIWDHGSRLSDEERSAVARALLDSGCRYAVCGGECCERWHDAVDEAFVMQHLGDSEDVRDAVFVMTSWHDGESPNDVAFFFVLNTNFDDHYFTRYLVLHVGFGKAREQVDAAVRKYALNEGVV